MDLPLVDKPVPAILMNYDNQTVITKVESSKDNMKSNKHIRMRLKAVRKLRNSGVIALEYVHHYKKRHIRDILGRMKFFSCHTYDTSMTIIVTKPGIIIDVVGSYFYDKKS